MNRMLKSTNHWADKARTQAGNQIKGLVVTAPAGLRETLDGLTGNALVTRCGSFLIIDCVYGTEFTGLGG